MNRGNFVAGSQAGEFHQHELASDTVRLWGSYFIRFISLGE